MNDDFDDDDDELWDHVTRSVRPLSSRRGTRKKPYKKSPRSVAGPGSAKPLPSVKKSPSSAQMDARNEKRLKRGEMDIEARLDLHGMRQDVAHRRLRTFIMQSYDRGLRCVLVITGKGGVQGDDARRPWYESGRGVLRERVPEWLAEGDIGRAVLRVITAQQKHGGSGALYVLLRRHK